MKLDQLPKQNNPKRKKIVGRGHGTGKGKTAGRGTKGQKARGKVRLGFEGGQLRIIKRLPFRRGVGNKPGSDDLGVNLDALKGFKKGDLINVEALVTHQIISSGEAKRRKIKILGRGEIDVALSVELPTTSSAAEKILAAGGKVLENSASSK